MIRAKLVKKFILSIILLSTALASNAQWDKDVFSWRGRTALSDGKYAQAIENFNILIQLDTTDYWSYFYRGIAKYNLGDLRGAQKDFDRSVTLDPVFTNGYHYRAITKSRFGEYDAALEDLQKAISLRPGLTGLYFSRGVTYFLSQRFDEAVKDFNRYIRKEPDDPGAYLNRGASYLFLADTTRALEDYNKAISLDRFDAEGYVRRGRLYAGTGELDKAIEDMNKAVTLDSTNTFAYFNRALLYYESKDYNLAMADLNRVLRDEPGNALTLYNRSLISAQVGDYNAALSDMDRVININPGNVLAYYNRAAVFMEMNRWQDAIDDYSKAIELYPDFAKAYLNRSYAENMLGRKAASKADYDTAQRKVREYREKGGADGTPSLADTTGQYSSLLALDADFAKKDFNDELLQYREVDVRLRALYKFQLVESRERLSQVLTGAYENPALEAFTGSFKEPIAITNQDAGQRKTRHTQLSEADGPGRQFALGLQELQNKQYNAALGCFNAAIDGDESYRRAFYLINRAALRAEMIDFIASMESNVQTLTMDDKGAVRARVSDNVGRNYDWSEAIADLEAAAAILPDMPYIYFNLGNLHCLSSQLVSSIEDYDKAIKLYPAMGDAYYNRGLVLIYLKDKEKGCIDLSRAGELGVADAYSVISKYCKGED